MLSDDLIAKLRKDLNKTGFRSEIDCIQTLSQNGWTCSGGAAYFDLDNEITRNIDVQAHVIVEKNRTEPGGIEVEYLLNIEVKKTERPWVVFQAAETFVGVGDAWNNPCVMKNLPCEPFDLVPSLRLISIREELKWLGYSVHEAFKEPNDTGRWFAAAVTACKACSDYVRRDPFVGEHSESMFVDRTFLLVTQPVVVLDGPLVAVSLNDESEVEFSEVPYAPFEFDFGTAKYPKRSYRVDLVSLSSLKDYLAVARRRAESLFDNIVDFSATNRT